MVRYVFQEDYLGTEADEFGESRLKTEQLGSVLPEHADERDLYIHATHLSLEFVSSLLDTNDAFVAVVCRLDLTNGLTWRIQRTQSFWKQPQFFLI